MRATENGLIQSIIMSNSTISKVFWAFQNFRSSTWTYQRNSSATLTSTLHSLDPSCSQSKAKILRRSQWLDKSLVADQWLLRIVWNLSRKFASQENSCFKILSSTVGKRMCLSNTRGASRQTWSIQRFTSSFATKPTSKQSPKCSWNTTHWFLNSI